MSCRAASPFDQLLGLAPARLPKSAATVVVVEGQIVTDARQIKACGSADQPADDQDLADARRLKQELARARDRARYQRDRQSPERMAKRQAWADANREKVRAYKKAYDKKNRARLRKVQSEWARRNYHADPEAGQQKQREYYARNREKILAGLKAKRDAVKAAKAAATSKGQP